MELKRGKRKEKIKHNERQRGWEKKRNGKERKEMKRKERMRSKGKKKVQVLKVRQRKCIVNAKRGKEWKAKRKE